MPDYPYTTVPGRIRGFLETIRSVAVPEKANRNWLPKIGLNSSNDRTMLSVLKYIGFINERGNPTDLWKNYRRANHEEVLGDAIRAAYNSLFDVYENPCGCSTKELKDYFRAETESAEGTISKMVDTFNALCRMASFKPGKSLESVVAENHGIGMKDVGHRKFAIGQDPGKNVTINININLPETMDEEVYKRIFKALKEELFSMD